MTEYELGYLAGFIDGEGSLIINKREHIGYLGKRYVGYSAYLDIGNTNRECLEFIKKLLNVSSNIYLNQGTGNRKMAYRLRISYKQAKPLIEKIQEKLIVKKEISKIFLCFQQENIDKEKLFLEAKKLNKRGIL